MTVMVMVMAVTVTLTVVMVVGDDGNCAANGRDFNSVNGNGDSEREAMVTQYGK